MFRKILVGRSIVLPSTAIVQSLALIRNLLVARIIGPEQFGIAAIFILVGQFLDLTTDTGLNKFLLSHRHGQKSALQASVHYVALFRGLALGSIMLVVAYPVLRLMHANPSLIAVILLAALPVAVGSLHYDNARLQQKGVFLNDAASQVVGEMFGISVTVTVAYLTGSYVAVIAGLLSRAIGQSIGSHLMAHRPYQIRMYSALRVQLFHYSFPLMLNGFVLFLSMQSDRALVAVFFAPVVLGVYAASMQLLTSASTILTKTIGATFLPTIANAHLKKDNFREHYLRLADMVIWLHIAMITLFAAIGPYLIPLIYGPRFKIDPMLVALVGTVQGIRLVRVWPSTVSLALKHTRNVLGGNLLRLSALPVAACLVALGYQLDGLLIGYAFGEFVALALTVQFLSVPSALAGPSRRRVFAVGLAAVMVVSAVTAAKWDASLLTFVSIAMVLVGAIATAMLVRLIGRSLRTT